MNYPLKLNIAPEKNVTVFTNVLSSKTVLNDNNKSCDTEDWSNDHHRNKLNFKIFLNINVISNGDNISQYYCFTVFF